jgi:hypothetical protein
MSTESTLTKEAVAKVAQGFRIYGSLLESHPYGSGHINDTLAVTFSQSGTRVRYILQRINHRIFKDPAALMENILRVTDEATARLTEAGVPDASRRALSVIPAAPTPPPFRSSSTARATESRSPSTATADRPATSSL